MNKNDFEVQFDLIFQKAYDKFQKDFSERMQNTLTNWENQNVKEYDKLSEKLFLDSLYLSTKFTYDFVHGLFEFAFFSK